MYQVGVARTQRGRELSVTATDVHDEPAGNAGRFEDLLGLVGRRRGTSQEESREEYQ